MKYFQLFEPRAVQKLIGDVQINYQIERQLFKLYRFKQLIIELIAINWQSIMRVCYFNIVDTLNSVCSDYVYNDIPVIAIEFHGPGHDASI